MSRSTRSTRVWGPRLRLTKHRMTFSFPEASAKFLSRLVTVASTAAATLSSTTQFSYRVGIDRGELKKVQTQMFIRYADRYARSHDLVFQTSKLRMHSSER